MDWKFADITLLGKQYTVTMTDTGQIIVAVHFSRWMPGSLRQINSSRRIDAKGKIGRQVVTMAREQWNFEA